MCCSLKMWYLEVKTSAYVVTVSHIRIFLSSKMIMHFVILHLLSFAISFVYDALVFCCQPCQSNDDDDVRMFVGIFHTAILLHFSTFVHILRL